MWLYLQMAPGQAKADEGRLNLYDWDWDQAPIVALNGEWVFYPHQFIIPGQAEPAGARLVRLPSQWDAAMKSDGGADRGYASYRLQLHIDASLGQTYRIRVPSVPSSAALYVNGQLLAQSGQPASAAENVVKGYVPFSGEFKPETNQLQIVILVSNFEDHAFSGILQPVKIGIASRMEKSTFLAMGIEGAVCLLLLLYVIFSFILFFVGVRQRAIIYFALLVACAIVSILIDDERLLQRGTSISYEWVTKLLLLSFMGASLFNMQFIRTMESPYPLPVFSRWLMRLCLLYAALIVVLPSRLLSYTDTFHTLLTAVLFLMAPILAFRAYRKGDADMLFILLGVSAIMSNMTWGIIKSTGLIESGYYPFDTIIAFLFFSLYGFKRYFRATSSSVMLAERLLQANKKKDEFLVNTAHELRNPLHAIMNMAQAILESGTANQGSRNEERLRLLLSVGKRMTFMLNDLLDLDRFKEGKIRLNPEPVHLQPLVVGLLDMVSYMTEGKRIVIKNEVSRRLPPVYADEGRLLQILFNLLHNAIKFTHKGEICIQAEAVGGEVRIHVADTGIGMDEATMLRIFHPYEQGGGQSGEYVSGLGLGLAISRQLAELHHGTIKVSSKRNEGSIFTLHLPSAASMKSKASLNETEELETSAIQQQWDMLDHPMLDMKVETRDDSSLHSLLKHREKPRILAVDDDPLNLHVLENVLDGNRYILVSVASAKEALERLHSEAWDLLITDIMMPGMSGYELTREARLHFSHSELPILLLTAKNQIQDMETGFAYGANDYLSKPVDRTELLARVYGLTEAARAAREQARIEAAWMQAQIEPHFLFNTLNAIAALSEIDTERMRNLIDAFSEYLRNSYDFQNSDQLSTLDKELKLVRAYLRIEQERFGDRLEVVWRVDEELTPQLSVISIPPLTIQPLVENAVRHGIMPRAQGGTIRISVSSETAHIKIAIHDNGVGMDREKIARVLSPGEGRTRKGIGLRNTDYRLKKLYGAGLSVISAPNEGAALSFLIPHVLLGHTEKP
ncbi:ATP-binding protein [Paenibacillus sp. HB172176]|uniref:hybrid sensor histidine kinase/response regulator n=1 Tax=Paenibacillus sp. HB172176 TaxID=2493690 RepID=UPI00143897CF|nr:ATP-binding protein [Paenibacillus sp. HB172176]